VSGNIIFISKPQSCPYDTKENYTPCEECPDMLNPETRYPSCEIKYKEIIEKKVKECGM